MNISILIQIWLFSGTAVLCLLSYKGSALNPYELGLLSSLTVVGGITLVFQLLAKALGLHSKSFKICVTVLLGFLVFVTATNWYYFDFFRSFYTNDILALGSDLFSGTQALELEAHKGSVLLLLFLFALTLTPVWINKLDVRPSKLAIITSFTAFITLLLVSERGLAYYQAREVQWLVPANIHPLHAFFSTTDNGFEITPQEQSAFTYFKNRSSSISQEPNISLESTDYNLIIILLESSRADMTGLFNNKYASATPYFDSLVDQGVIGRRHYSNTTHTSSAELNLWCGVFDRVGEAKLAHDPKAQYNFTCLPEKLSEAGYDTHYYHANSGTFYNRRELLPRLGFKELYFYRDEKDPLLKGEQIGWGIDDVTMFKTMLYKLLDRPDPEKRFMAHITTISNHFPFHWKVADKGFTPLFNGQEEPTTLYQDYLNMVSYTDYAMGQFWADFKQSELATNTIVVITSDHGIWQFADPSIPLIEKNERFFRAPLFIYHPALKNNEAINEITSHIDVHKTLADMLNVETSPLSLGRNILKPTDTEPWVLMGKGTDTVLRAGDNICFMDIEDCDANQQFCIDPHGKILLKADEKNFKSCYRIDGNMFGDYELHPADSSLMQQYEQAKLMRSYVSKSLTISE